MPLRVCDEVSPTPTSSPPWLTLWPTERTWSTSRWGASSSSDKPLRSSRDGGRETGFSSWRQQGTRRPMPTRTLGPSGVPGQRHRLGGGDRPGRRARLLLQLGLRERRPGRPGDEHRLHYADRLRLEPRTRFAERDLADDTSPRRRRWFWPSANPQASPSVVREDGAGNGGTRRPTGRTDRLRGSAGCRGGGWVHSTATRARWTSKRRRPGPWRRPACSRVGR